MVMYVRQIYALIILPVIMLSLITVAVPVAAQEDEEARKLAEKMIMLAERALNYAKNLIDKLRELGADVPSEALEAIDNATTHLDKAKEALDAGNYREAVRLALNAMKGSKHTVRTCLEACHRVGVNVTVITEVTEGNVTVKKAFGLLMQIEWLRRIIERFSQMNLTVLGENATAVEEKLEELKAKLDEAEEKLREGVVNETAIILAGVKRDLFKLIAEYHREIAKIHMEVRLKNYMKHLKMFLLGLRKKLEKLEEDLEKLRNEGVNVTVYINKVRELNETITEVLIKIEAGNVTRETVVHIFVEIAKLYPKIKIIKIEKEIVPRLGERARRAREILEKTLKTQEERVKKIMEQLEEKIKKAKKKGLPTFRLEMLKEQLSKILEQIKKHKHTLLEKLEEIEEHLEELLNEINSVVEEAEET